MDQVEKKSLLDELLVLPSEEEDDPEYEARPPASVEVDGDCCRNKCMSNFDEEFKSRLKSELLALQKSEKQIYLFAMLSINEEFKCRVKNMKSPKYFQYTVKEYGISRSVCKSAFIALHDTTPSMVRNLCNKLSTNYLIPTDERGKHDRQPTISEHTKELIKSHFCDTLNSSDIFKCVKKRHGKPNINQLWLDFKEKYGNLSRATYSKYIQSVITPEVLEQFMCANEAKQILIFINNYVKHVK